MESFILEKNCLCVGLIYIRTGILFFKDFGQIDRDHFLFKDLQQTEIERGEEWLSENKIIVEFAIWKLFETVFGC